MMEPKTIRDIGNGRLELRRAWTNMVIDRRVDSRVYQIWSHWTCRMILVCVVYDRVWLRPRGCN